MGTIELKKTAPDGSQVYRAGAADALLTPLPDGTFRLWASTGNCGWSKSGIAASRSEAMDCLQSVSGLRWNAMV